MRRLWLLSCWVLPAILSLGATAEEDDPTDSDRSRLDSVVFDIDGTLTYNTFFDFTVRRKSRAAMDLWLEMGYGVVIVTARPQIYEWWTRQFLSLWNFPLEEVQAWSFAPQRLGSPEEKGAYKSAAITNLSQSLDLNIMYAYGDSTWDFEAYVDAGIDPSRVFAFRRQFERDCMEGDFAECLEDFTDHLAYIEDQPFLLR